MGYGGGDHTSTYRIPSGPSTSKASQLSGGSNVGADAAQGGPHPSTSSQHGKAAKIRSGMINDGHIPSGVRSLSANLRYPYKRTISAPAGMGLTQKSSHSRGTLEKEMSTASGPMGPSGISTGGQNTP